jgi:pyrophosphatase PpaX
MADPKKVDTLLFDLDGTLIDSFNAYYEIARQACKKIGHTVPTLSALQPVMNEGHSFFDYCFPKDLPDRESKIESFINESKSIWTDVFLQHVKIMPGLSKILETLHKEGYKLAIVTSSGMESVKPLIQKDLIHYFSAVITRENVRKKKPDPEPIFIALKHIRSTPDQAMIIGDTPLDIRAGKSANILTAGVLTGTAARDKLKAEGPDYILSDLKDLLTLLKVGEKYESISGPSITIQGDYSRGLGEGSGFLSIEWVKQKLRDMLGFTVYPGTFNLELFPSSAKKYNEFIRFYAERSLPFASKAGFCDASLFPATIQTNDKRAQAYVLIPHVPNYGLSKVEFISPLKLTEHIQNNDQSLSVFATVYLPSSSEAFHG